MKKSGTTQVSAQQVQQTQTPAGVQHTQPIITPDVDKIRFMQIDRKELVEALASEYEDAKREELSKLIGNLEDKVKEVNKHRLNISYFELNNGDLNKFSKETQAYMKAVLKSVEKQITNVKDAEVTIEILDSNGCITASENIDSKLLTEYAKTIREQKVRNNPNYTENSYHKSYSYMLRSLGNTKENPWVNTKDGYIKIDVECTTRSDMLVSSIKKKKESFAAHTTVYLPIPIKEVDTVRSARDKAVADLIADANKIIEIEKDLSDLPIITRRLKAKLTKKAMANSDSGKKLLEYFEAELEDTRKEVSVLPSYIYSVKPSKKK